jgi:hypothetical protein
MATNSGLTSGNLLDVHKFQNPQGGAITKVLNTMNEIDHFTKDMPALPANSGIVDVGLRQIQLPTGYIVDIGGSWKESKSEFEPYVEGLVTIRSTYKAPTDTYETVSEAVGRAQLQANLDGHIAMMNQSVTNIMLEGATTPSQSVIMGLMERVPYTTTDEAFCFNAGGTGTDLRSAWLMKPGVDTVHALYNPNHPTLGVEQKDMGVHPVQGLGTSSDEHRWDMWVEFRTIKGLTIRDQTAVKRIANIDVGSSSFPGDDVINLAIDASIINATKLPGMGQALGTAEPDVLNTWMLYCDERLYAKLVRAQNDKTFVYSSAENIYRTNLPMIGTNIIIRRMDALNHAIGSGETVLS